jgi:antitoxin component YwqK of YwqJK toxin-antitoxin module
MDRTLKTLLVLALLAVLEPGCSSGVFVSCPDGATKVDTSNGGYACQRADGTAHGPFRKLHPSGAVAETGTFVDGLEDGVYETWFEDGKTSSMGTYRLGKFWSTFRVWHDNGELALERGYEEGVPIGIHRWTDDEGLLSKELQFVDGKRVRLSRYGRGGAKTYESLWKAEVQLREEIWNADGVKLLEAIGLHGEAGTLRKWNEAGKMVSLAQYVQGHPTAESVFYGNGAVREKRGYGDGGRILSFEAQDENGALLRRMAFDAEQSATTWPSEEPGTLGFSVQIADDVGVSTVTHGGPAAMAGLRAGVKIVSIADWQLPSSPDQGLVHNALMGPVGELVKLVVQPATGLAQSLEMKRVHRDSLDRRRTLSDRWSVAGTRVEQLRYKNGFLVEERRWFDSGNKHEAADYDEQGRLVWHRKWHESGQMSDEIAPLQGETHLLWQSWDELGSRTGRGAYLWGTSDKAGSLLKDGSFSYWSASEVLKSTVQWKAGLKDGEYASFYDSGEPHESGEFKDDLKDGKWTVRREPGQGDSNIPSNVLESTQMFAQGKKHGGYESFDAQCGWWVEKGSFKEGVKHGEWLSRPGPRYYSCDESGMATRGTWNSRNRAETCSQGNYRDGLKYGVWKTRKDCWCEEGSEVPCEVLVRKYGNDEILLSEEVKSTF